MRLASAGLFALVPLAAALAACGGGGDAVPPVDAGPVPPDAAVFEPVDVILERVSVATDGTEASAASTQPVASADGRYVAFVSAAPEFAVDGNGIAQVYVVDREEPSFARASVAPGVPAGDGASSLPTLSDDGRTIAFESLADDLAANARAGVTDVFVRNLDNEVTALASADLESDATRPNISGDGNLVLFDTTVTADTPQGPRSESRVMEYVPGTEAPVVFTGDGVPAAMPDISGDGNFAAFAIGSDLWRYERATGAAGRTTRVLQAEGLDARLRPSIDTTGERIAFTTGNRIFVVVVGTQTLRVSQSYDGQDPNGPCTWPSLSGDGRFAAFACDADNLVPDDDNDARDVFLHDIDNQRIVRLSIAADRSSGNGASDQPFITRDGRFIVFSSAASNLVAGDENGVADVFIASNPLL